MSLEEETKNDSRKILPKINWNSREKNKIKSLETNTKIKPKKLNIFKTPKLTIKRSPTSIHLIKINMKNYQKIEKNAKLEINKEIINLMKNDFPTLKSPKFLTFRNNSIDTEKDITSNIKNINKNNSNKSNFSTIINNKLIINKIKNIKIRHSNNIENRQKNSFIRNNNYLIGRYTPMSAFNSYSKRFQKNNFSFINLHKNFNKNNKNFSNSNNNKSFELSQLSKNIFISKLNLKSHVKEKILKKNKYQKKWDLPKSFSFEKIAGRQKEEKNPIKLHILERLYEYEPNYDSILCNQNKVYVKYSNDFNKDFKHYKINSTRKYIYNSSSIMNNPGTNYNIVNILNKHKEMEQKKIEDKKIIKILEDYIEYNKKINQDVD